MNCKSYQNLFSEYHDRELDDNSCHLLDKHLASCKSCSTEWLYFQKTVTLLNSLSAIAAPVSVLPEIQRKLSHMGTNDSFFKKVFTRFHEMDFSLSPQAATATFATAMAVMAAFKYFPRPLLENATSSNLSPQPQAARQITATQEGKLPQDHAQISKFTDTKRTSTFWNVPQGLLASDYLPTIFLEGQRPSVQGENTYQGNAAPHSLHSQIHNDTVPYTNLRHSPDIIVKVSKRPDSDHGDLLTRLLASEKWRAQILDTTNLRLIIAPADMGALQEVLSSHDTEFSPPYTRYAATGYPKEELQVNINLR